MRRKFGGVLCAVAALSACSGGGGGGGGVSSGPITSTPGPTPTPSSSSSACTLRARQDWALAQLREWYLFPETLPTSPDPTAYTTVEDYIDALTANARALRRDRFFTYLTSIAGENAFFSSGASAGFGIRLATDTGARRVFVTEAFEGAPALAAGIDRGTEIVAIGTTVANLRTVTAIIAAEGSAGVSNALGPNTAGTTRLLRVTDASGTRDLTVAKADYSLSPLSDRYGAKVIDDGGRKVGYINLRTFISTADPQLRSAFGNFRAQGVTDIIVDVRYNGGGLVSTAELIGDLLGGARSTSEVQGYTTFRPEKASNNETRFFRREANALSPTRIAFIGTGGSASASELIINAQIPYFHTNAALIGTNTYGKPVGQIALDQSACDDRLRVVAFATQNAARQGDYYDGLATTVEASCQAGDDFTRQLGDPAESSTRQALDFLAGRSCTRIGASATGSGIGASAQSSQSAKLTARRDLLIPERPTPAQREVPGLF